MTDSPRIGAIVLAGGGVPASLAGHCSHRALLRLGDRLLLDYLLKAVAQVPGLAGISIVAPAEALGELASLPGHKIAAGDSIVENMQLGAAPLRANGVTHLLFITGDIPLVTPEGLTDYINLSVQSGAELTYPIIPRAACEARFPGAKRTYVRLTDGTFTGGNLIFTTATLLDDKQALIQGLYAARKHPIKLAQILGWSTVFRMVTGKLSLSNIEAVGTRILCGPVRAIITQYAEIGFDVDKPEDLAAVEQALARAGR